MEKPETIFELLEDAKATGAPDKALRHRIATFLEQKARATTTPNNGHFELTPLCNLDCKMCYVHLRDNQLGENSLLSAANWIDLMQQAIDAGMIRATLSGGECLTYPQFDEVYLFLKSKGIIVSIMTNGVLLTKERIEFFKRHMPRVIQVSLYGTTEDVYESVTGKRVFSTVINNIEAAKAAGLSLCISITPSRYMAGAVKDIIRLAKDLDVTFGVNPCLNKPRKETGRDQIEHDLTLEDYAEIFKYLNVINGREIHPTKVCEIEPGRENEYEMKGLRCGAGKSSFVIRWNGDMLPCTEMDSITENPLKIGFKNAWEFISKKTAIYPRFTKCESCEYSRACCFCPAENEKLGSRYVLNPIWCERTRVLVESGARPI